MKFIFAAVTAVLAGSAAGCVTSGVGAGDLLSRGQAAEPVLFSWTSKDGGLSGNMVATLADATYSGPFFQITRQTVRDGLAPLWNGWTEAWDDWPYWYRPWPGTYNITQFITHYSGKVVANLETHAGLHMRCRFHLADPIAGMSGGGQGECQLPGGRHIDAQFPRH